MRFRYTDIPNHKDPLKPFHRPYLIVRLLNSDKHKDVIPLVDSGADIRGLSLITLEVGFTHSMVVGTGLLGQRGFFEQFQINFELSQKFFEVAPVNL